MNGRVKAVPNVSRNDLSHLDSHEAKSRQFKPITHEAEQ